MQTREQIEKIVGEAEIPDYVKEFRLNLDTDSTGDPAVYIDFIIADEEAERPEFFEHMNSLEARIFSALLKAKIEEWPYFHVRTVSEERELKEDLEEEERREQEEVSRFT